VSSSSTKSRRESAQPLRSAQSHTAWRGVPSLPYQGGHLAGGKVTSALRPFLGHAGKGSVRVSRPSPATTDSAREAEEGTRDVDPTSVISREEEAGPGGANGNTGVGSGVQAGGEEEVRTAGKLALHGPFGPFALGLAAEEGTGGRRGGEGDHEVINYKEGKCTTRWDADILGVRERDGLVAQSVYCFVTIDDGWEGHGRAFRLMALDVNPDEAVLNPGNQAEALVLASREDGAINIPEVGVFGLAHAPAGKSGRKGGDREIRGTEAESRQGGSAETTRQIPGQTRP